MFTNGEKEIYNYIPILEGSFYQGKKDGTWISYEKRDRKHGPWTCESESIRPIKEEVYGNGVLISTNNIKYH